MSEAITVENAIEVTRLPEIRERLLPISARLQERLAAVLAMEVSDETYKEVKNLRASLNKDFSVLERKRKEVRGAILAPYDEFEKTYGELITRPFNDGVATISNRVIAVERGLKLQKEQAARDYFQEYKLSRSLALPGGSDLDFVEYGRSGITANLSSSLKSLKEQAKAFIDGVVSDVGAISVNANAAEVMAEYRKNLDLGASISMVCKRRKEIEEQRARAEKARIEREERERARAGREPSAAGPIVIGAPDIRLGQGVAQAGPDAPAQPPITAQPANAAAKPPEPDPVCTLNFKVTATRTKLRALKQYLVDGGYYFE